MYKYSFVLNSTLKVINQKSWTVYDSITKKSDNKTLIKKNQKKLDFILFFLIFLFSFSLSNCMVQCVAFDDFSILDFNTLN